ncbi:MAG TPA: carboxypeptidase-like regulatory domain-containing protein [Vicinamibacterales bacterium]|nr:carboxypeptidase-like regulatory domain-containing protein [Vicinamibacterales bacterium]
MAFIRVYRGFVAATIAVIVFGLASSAAAQATATVAGTIKDTQGAVIPGATVTLISESRGTTFDTQSTATGDFVISNIPGDTYTVRVTMDGFKTSERKGIPVSLGDRVAVPPITIEVGTLAETVLVTGDAPIIQAQTGDRSFVVALSSVENLPVAGRNFAGFAVMTPGVLASGSAAVRADGARTNYILDGISSVNTGGNQQGLTLNQDSIAEVKVISTGYQAEYGRTSGIQISGITKSGTNQFRGSTYDIERRTAWNSNSWVNAQNGNAKAVADQRDWGYTIGGPVGKPGGKNNLFFFYSEQFSPRLTGGAISRIRVPTLLERQGDFSQTTDNTGALFNLIRDSTTGLPCAAADTRGCFQDGGVLGRIPQNRLYGLGLNILKLYPAPNTQGVNYNLQTVTPNIHSDTFQHLIRVDYQMSSKLRLSAKYAGQNATVQPIFPAVSIPGFNDQVFQFPAILVPSATVDYTINSTTVFEGTWGLTQGNQLGNVPIDPSANRYNVGLGDFPTLYPNNGAVDPSFYQAKVLAAMKAPYYVNGSILMAPNFSWGTRIANPPPNNAYPPFLCMQNTKDLALSITKLWGSHTFKAGYQSQDSLKLQNLGTVDTGVLPVEGAVSFANDSNNPLDTGFGFSNAAIGVFQTFQQQNAMYEGRYVYHNKDFFLQDNWKMTDRLTLDYGMRFTHHGQQYDQLQQASNFFPNLWSSSVAPLLYTPGCSINANPCPSANRVAVNPATGVSLGVGSSLAISTIVPRSGVLMNGIIQAGHGIAKQNYNEQPLVFGPRVGFAYDLTGTQTIVLRGSVGLFYDRLQGDSIFGQIGNPPTGQASTVTYSTLQAVAAGTSALQPAPTIVIYHYDAKIGASVNYNGGVQMVLPWSSALDVSYVGAHNYNSVAFGSISTPSAASYGLGALPLDLNAPDPGTAYLPQYQDPTLAASAIPGASAVTTDLLRPYRGLGSIVTTWPRFYTQYDSIQTTYNRRFHNGWQAGLAWTLGLRFNGNTFSPIHLQHNADGTIGVASYQAQDDALLSNVGLRRHIIKAQFAWQLPELKGSTTASKVLGAVVDGWGISGIFTGGSGARYDAFYSYQSNGTNVNLTGSPSYAARIKVVGNPGSGCSSNPYQQFNASAFQGPTYGSTGNESGTNLLVGCPDHTLDLGLSRMIALGGNRQLQFRMDAFNVLNTVVYNARQVAIQYNTPADPTTIRNNQYNADGTVNQTRLTPANAGAGAATGAQAMRTLQAQLRFIF